MKTIFSLILASLLLAAGAVSVSAAVTEPSDKVVTIPRVDDGAIDYSDVVKDELYDLCEAQPMVEQNLTLFPDSPSSSTGQFWACYDSEFIYLYVEVTDPVIDHSGIDPWNSESIGVQVDFDYIREIGYQISDPDANIAYIEFSHPENYVIYYLYEREQDLADNLHMNAIKDTGDGRKLFELALPIPDDFLPEDGIKIGFEVKHNNAENGTAVGCASWSVEGFNAFQHADRAGTLIFGGKTGEKNSEYLSLSVVNDAEVIDDDTTQDQGGSGNPIQIMADYGCGYSSLGDMVVFNDVDFGANGAASARMHFGFGDTSGAVTTLAFYIDDPEGTPVLETEVGNTGGWDIASSGWVDLALAVPAGTHTLYVEFTNELSGSLSELVFTEAEPAPATAGAEYLSLSVVNDAEVIDDDTTQDQGGSGNPIQIMADYGCGYSSLGDMVVFNDVDFGANGAASARMHFGFGDTSGAVTTLAFYIDDPEGTPVLETEVGNTGGWDIASSGWVDLALAVPAGTHTLYVEFTNELSGSLSELVFTEAEPAPVVEEPVAEEVPVAEEIPAEEVVIEEVVEEVVEAPATETAPQTFDFGVVTVISALVSAAGYALTKKNR